MSCPYYTFRQNDYYCTKKQDYVNSDIYYRYCRNYSYDECPIYKGESNSGGCYLTSACVNAKGLPDDCLELTVLRNFRDNWLRHQENGLSEIAEYYASAPIIVDRINAKADGLAIWNELYQTLIVPCVQLIQSNNMEQAYRLYKEITLKLIEV